MDRIHIEILKGGQTLSYEVVDYMHHENDHCKFEVFSGEKLLASFEPDKYGHLHLCKNPGNVDKVVLHEIAEKLESYNLY